MKLSLFWKLMLAFALVLAIGLSAVVVLASQVTNRELHQLMMGGDGQGMGGMMGRGPELMQANAINRINRAVVLGGLLALLAALAIGFVLFRGITRPIEQLTSAAHSLSQGDLTTRVDTQSAHGLGGDELAELASTFNAMADHLQRTEQLRRDMTADVAHELRTPLSVMRGNLEAMLDGVYPMDAEHLRPALDQVQLLTRLVDDLRTLALAEAGQLALERKPVDLDRLVADRLPAFQAQAAAQQVELRWMPAPGLPRVEIDPDRIWQTIAILISNALRHTPPGGSIDLKATRDDGHLQIEVADTGSGIPAEDLPRVFERFYRADKSRSRVGGGSGLGLAIARSIVEAHGGTIQAASQAGRGTKMTIGLPIAAKP